MTKDYSGTPMAEFNGTPVHVLASRHFNDGKTIEITDDEGFDATLRITLNMTKDNAIRLAIRLLPQDTMIRVVQMLAEEDQ